jgi:hypothetical protein
MNALKERIIEKLDGLPDQMLKQVLHYLAFLEWKRRDKRSSLLSVAGGLSGAPRSVQEIEKELYGPVESR